MTPVIVPVPDITDADPSHRPKTDWIAVESPTVWLEKLGGLWMERRGEAKPGVRYYLNHLPRGYVLFRRARPGNPKVFDNHLFGHPRRAFFDSPNRFWPHFLHLMTHRTNEGCSCTICAAKNKRPDPIVMPMTAGSTATVATVGTLLQRQLPQSDSSTGRIVPNFTARAPQPPRLTIPTETSQMQASQRTPTAISSKPTPPFTQHDEEGIPDTIRQCINTLKADKTLDVRIEEKYSMDWRAEQACLPEFRRRLERLGSWVPRVGEIVLFTRSPVTIAIDSPEAIIWEAAVVAQIPVIDPHLRDYTSIVDDAQSVTHIGFRVEPLPDPNKSKEKSYTKQYTYVLLRQIRPFALYQHFIPAGIKAAHPTIRHALTIMSSVSLVNRFRFKGNWPKASIFCGGIWLGSELIVEGDVVRLLPKHRETSYVTDVLHVRSIRLEFTNIDKANGNDWDDGHPYNTSIYLYGQAFRVDPYGDRQYLLGRGSSTDAAAASLGLKNCSLLSKSGLGSWLPLHGPSEQFRVSFSRVLGRMYETAAMRAWLPVGATGIHHASKARNLLDEGLEGIQAARYYSSRKDKRIIEGKSWYWSDSRAETLDIETLNAVGVSYRDEDRQIEQLPKWWNAVRVLERTASAEERRAVREEVPYKSEREDASSRRPSPPHKKMRTDENALQRQNDAD